MTTQPNDQGIRWIDAHLHLLDRQIHDAHGLPIAVVDDLELSDVPVGEDIPPDTALPVITALLSGPVLGARIFGGRPPRSRSQSVPVDRHHRHWCRDQIGHHRGNHRPHPGPSDGYVIASSDASQEAGTRLGKIKVTILQKADRGES